MHGQASSTAHDRCTSTVYDAIAFYSILYLQWYYIHDFSILNSTTTTTTTTTTTATTSTTTHIIFRNFNSLDILVIIIPRGIRRMED